MALTGTLSWQPIALQTSQLDLVTATGTTPTGAAGTAFGPLVVTDGTGANQATNYASDTRTLAAGASEALDFNGGLVDAFGNVLLFTRLILFLVKASPSNIADVQVRVEGAAPIASLAFNAGSIIGVPPGGCVFWAARTAAAYSVVPGVGDQLTFSNASGINPCTYDIIAVGS